MRRAARTDANHRELFDLARALGAFVLETHQLGHGAPDGFVWSRGTSWFAVEIKHGTRQTPSGADPAPRVCAGHGLADDG